jgi:MFS family permease
MGHTDVHDAYAALRSASYRRFLFGNVLSAIALEMQSVAIGWELYQRTNSPAAIGFVGLAQFLPVFILALPAGHAADLFSRKWTFVLAQVTMAVGSATLGTLSLLQGPIAFIYVSLVVVGVGRAFAAPARSALVPQLVEVSALTNAVTWNSSGWHVASMIGPAIGGGLIAMTGQAAQCYLAAASCCVACAVFVATVHPRPVERSTDPLTFRSLLAGVRFVWATPLILATITLDLFAVLFGGATALLPIYARDILEIGPTGLGWLRAAPAIGAFIMAITVAHRPPLKRAGRAMLLAVAGFGVATIVFGFSTNPILSFAMLALTGALDNISMIVRGTLIQLLTPDPMRGRVSAVNTIFIVTSNELGAFESGMVAELFGPIVSAVSGGIGSLLVVAAVAAHWPEVRKLGSLRLEEKVE